MLMLLTFTREDRDMVIAEKLDELGKPAWIALMILSFIAFWPLGLAILAFLIWSGRMGCGGQRALGTQDDENAGQNGPHADAISRAAKVRSGAARRAATTRSTNIAPRRSSASKTNSANFTSSWSGFGSPRTRPSSTSSWPIAATTRHPASRSRARSHQHRYNAPHRPPIGPDNDQRAPASPEAGGFLLCPRTRWPLNPHGNLLLTTNTALWPG